METINTIIHILINALFWLGLAVAYLIEELPSIVKFIKNHV